MSNSAVCRLCLTCNVRMRVIVGTPLQETYESLTNVSLKSKGKPFLACYICYNLLKKCKMLAENALKAEETLTRLLDSGVLITPAILSLMENQLNLACLSITPPVHQINIFQDGLVEDCGEIIDEQKVKLEEENQNQDDSLPDNHQSDPESCPAQSDSEDGVPLKIISTTKQLKTVKEHSQKHWQRSKDVDDATLLGLLKGEQDEHDEEEEIQQNTNVKLHFLTDSESTAKAVYSGNPVTNFTTLELIETETSKTTPDLGNKASDIAVLLESQKKEISDEQDEDEEILAMLNEEQIIIEQDLNLQSFYLTDSENSSDTLYDINLFHRSKTSKQIKSEPSEKTADLGNKSSGTEYVDVCSTALPRGVSFEPDKTFICNDCGKQFYKKTHLIQHIKSHTTTSNGYLNCPECDYRTERHLRLHDKTRLYQCDDCGRRYTKKSALREHIMKVQHSVDKEALKVHSCDICVYKTSRLSDLNRHLKTHTGEKPFSCSICGYKFSLKCNLKMHMKRHTGEKPYSCSTCGHKFSWKGNLKSHMQSHKGEKPFSCPVCGHKFSVKQTLNRHMKSHTGEKLFSCSMCTCNYSRKSYLNEHMRTHTGEKLFSCSMCTCNYSRKTYLNEHMRTHTGEKPFSCSICGRKFITKGYLNRHMRTHTGEKPFSCSICGHKFSQKGHLKMHMERHTG